MVLSQFAHNLLDILEFWVSISENNWDGTQVIKIRGPGALAELLPGGV